MAMETMQIRLSKEHMKAIAKLVKRGMYHSRNEAVRDAVRRLLLEVDKPASY